MADETIVTGNPAANQPIPGTQGTAPAPAPAAAAPVPVALPPSNASISPEQLQTFLGMSTRIAELEAQNRQRETAATEERIRLQTEKGQAVEAVQTLRTTKDAELKTERDLHIGLEDSAKRFALDGNLSRPWHRIRSLKDLPNN